MLAANILLGASSLACGLARNGGEVITFRGLQGVSSAMASQHPSPPFPRALSMDAHATLDLCVWDSRLRSDS